jgi:hypothetical protein
LQEGKNMSQTAQWCLFSVLHLIVPWQKKKVKTMDAPKKEDSM